MRKRMVRVVAGNQEADDSLYTSVSKEEVEALEKGTKMASRSLRKKGKFHIVIDLKAVLYVGTILAVTVFIATGKQM